MLKMETNLSGTDMISDLPDNLLTHILSFLRPREAVQTCILSKRWRTTWTSMPVLRFDYEKFLVVPKKRTKENWVKFVKFVGQVLQNRERLLSLDIFEFNCYPSRYPTDPFPIQCILLALKFNPRVFSLCASSEVFFYCAEPIFSCASLQNILLHDTSFREADKFLELKILKLPRLKKLELGWLRVDDNLFQMLFLGCPVLDELELLRCRLHVSLLYSEVLNSLVLSGCHLEKNLVISTRNLVHLVIDHTRSDGFYFSLENMASLVDVRIEYSNVYENHHLVSSNCGWNIHNHPSNFSMPDLTLENNQAKKVSGKISFNRSDFKILKSLHLGCSDLSNLFNSIALFLHNSPNLKKLSLEVLSKPEWCIKSSKEEWSNAKPNYEKCVDALLKQKHLEVVLIMESLFTREETVMKLFQELYSLATSTRKITFIVFAQDSSNYHHVC
ncbi:hypothetical protein LUZ63_014071 [Rhynchospora breviuscula]|uniref:F-box domain-containing protein n=1 Tax=Rhynchospora breviuscula TaxID=2022672 RepID=A0A9Q0C9P8_9POAL|nr:hypothetical protein LUZ63_014071 [Rhynchospora breviuscula]